MTYRHELRTIPSAESDGEGMTMMKLWNALSDDAKDLLLIAGFFLEAWFLFGVLA